MFACYETCIASIVEGGGDKYIRKLRLHERIMSVIDFGGPNT